MKSTLKLILLLTSYGMASSILAENNNPTVVMNTNRGEIVLEIFADKSPITATNFLKLVENDHYDGLIFHRVIDGFMIQAGGFTRDMIQKEPAETIKNEASNGVSNAIGTIAMARTSDPDSASAQFFINTENNVFLNATETSAGYAVFGKVLDGMEVVRDIEKSETGSEKGFQNVPVEKTVIHDIAIQ